jgi:hypothetical protein
LPQTKYKLSGMVAKDKVVAGVAGHAVNTIHAETPNQHTDPPSNFLQAYGKAA